VKKWWIGIFVVFALTAASAWMVIFVTGIGPYDLPPMAARLDAELERSRRLGLPQVQDELKIHAPASQNAALVIEPILDPKRLDPLFDAAFDYEMDRPGSETAARKAQSVFKSDLDLVVATRLPLWEIDRDYDYGPMVVFPQYAPIKGLSKALASRARVAAKDGRVADAIADLEAARRLAMWTAQEPILIGLLVSIAVEAISLHGYERCADELRHNPAGLKKLLQSLESTHPGYTLENALRSEYFWCLATARNLDNLGGIDALSNLESTATFRGPPVREGPPRKMEDRAMLTPIVKVYNDCFEEFNAKGWESGNPGAFMDREVNDLQSKFNMSKKLSEIVFPIFDGTDSALVKHKVHQELTALLIRSLIARQETGSWPEIKAKDPFANDQGYRTAISGDSIRIWSVGPNGKDDGGDVKDSYRDIVVASPR
jgi:hypothetical protein